MSSSSEDDFDEYIYHVVEFVKKGRPSSRSVDIVPIKWISFNKKQFCTEVKFKPPPYTTDDFNKIQKLTEDNEDAPEEWPSYKIKTVARAKTYVDALKKMKLVEDQRFAFTSESDIEPEKRSAMIVQKFKSKALNKNLDELKEIMNVKPITKSQDNEDSSNKTIKKRKIGEKCTFNEPTSKQQKLDADNHDPYLNDEDFQSTLNITNFQSTSVVADLIMPTVDDALGGKIIEIDNVEEETFDLTRLTETIDNVVKPYLGASKQNLNSGLNFKTPDDISRMIQEVAVTQRKILQNQNLMLNMLEVSGIIRDKNTIAQPFYEKYNLNLPLKTVEEFKSFDTLLSNPTILEEFMPSLQFLIDRHNNYGKTINNVLKKYLSRDLALQFNVQKQSGDKLLLKATNFCKCLLELVLNKHLKSNNEKLTEKEVLASLGTSLTNSKDWDGFRSKRSKKIQQSTSLIN